MSDAVGIYGLLIGYKVASLFVGLSLAFMGYRLFLADRTGSAGDLTTKYKTYELSLRGGAPGVFFSLFGAIVICVSLVRGVNYEDMERRNPSQSVELVLPSIPPE